MTMFIHLNSDGTIAKVLHDRVIRRSNVNKIYVFAPFAPGSTVLIHFQKPNGELITGPMIFKEFNLANQINTWEYSLMNRTITDIAGKVLISLEIRAITEGGVEITATPNTHMWVEESIGELPEIEEVDEFLNLANLAMERVIALEEEFEETKLTEEDKVKLNNLPLNTIAELENKVDKVAGKGLSTNDYTDAEKAKLAGIEPGAEVNTVNPEDLVADNISFDGSGTNFLTGETDVEGAIKELDIRVKTNTDKLDEISVRIINLIENGNFSKDTNNDGIADGFRAGGSNVTQPRIENNTQYWTPLSNAYSGSMLYNSHTFLKGHKYYIKADIANVRAVYINNHENNAVYIGRDFSDESWSSTFTVDEETTSSIVFLAKETNIESSISNFILVDLTTTFGFGKEPDIRYFEFILQKVGSKKWFDVVNLTGFSKRPIMSAKDLDVYDPVNELPGNNVNDILKEFNKGRVVALPGKNLYNPEKNVVGTIYYPAIYPGNKQKIDPINNPNNHVTQKIKITNTDNVTLSNVIAYSITDLQDIVIVPRTLISRKITTIASSKIQLEEYYLWVSVVDTEVGLVQVEMGSEATSYEPYTPVKAVYANGVKLFDYPFEVSQSVDKKKELYDLSKLTLENDTLAEKIMYLTNNAKFSNLTTGSEPKDSQVIPLAKTDKQKLILHLHKRPKEEGFGTTNDAYLPNAKDDFSDIRITADNGEVLPYRIIYKTNDFDIVPYDWTRKRQQSSATFQDSQGRMYQSDGGIRVSEDKGKTWSYITTIDLENPVINLIAQDDTMYFSSEQESKLYRSEYPYENYQEVLDLDPEGVYTGVHITGKSLVQHPDGELFAGLYQNEWRINIYKSIDNGLTWELSADWGDEYQHVHGMFVDEYTGAVYAGLDGGGGVLKTTDKGETWVDLRAQYPNMPQSTDYGVRYADPSGYRLLGGETPIVGGHSIIKTYDDENFYPVLSDGISVNYIVKMGDILFATGSGSYGFRNGAIYISRDDGETWKSVYRTAPLLDLWSANDGYRYMKQISENEIFVGPQSFSRPPLRIFGSGSYAEILVDIPAGTESITVESGHAYPNELPIYNDTEFTGEKLVHFELNENGNVIKELVSGELYQDDFEWTKGGKHLSYFYPYITSPLDENSVLLKSLNGYLVDSSAFDTSQGITISFWAKLSSGTRFLLFENETGDKLEIVNGYQLHFNNSNVVSFNYPVIPEPFQKHDLLISNDGSITVYTNGLLRNMRGTRGIEILNALSKGSKIKFLRNISSNDEDAIQHFVIRKGLVDEGQLLAEYNSGITDNI